MSVATLNFFNKTHSLASAQKDHIYIVCNTTKMYESMNTINTIVESVNAGSSLTSTLN